MSPQDVVPTVVQRFRDDLLAARPRTTGKRLAKTVPISVVAAVAVMLAIGAFNGTSPSTALAITQNTDGMVVRIADASARPWEMTQELRQAGIDAEVLRAPATEAAVGTWVKVESPRVASAGTNPAVHDDFDPEQETSAAQERMQGVVVERDLVRIPADFNHSLVLVVGQAPEGGEQPVYDTNGRVEPNLP